MGFALTECSYSQETKLFSINYFSHPHGCPLRWVAEYFLFKKKKVNQLDFLLFYVLCSRTSHSLIKTICMSAGGPGFLNHRLLSRVNARLSAHVESQVGGNLDDSVAGYYEWHSLELVQRDRQ